MSSDIFTALVIFAFVSSVTPGPNNLMLMASGANFGVWRTVPHMLGISCGFGLMVLLVGVGLIRVFDTFPLVYTVLKILSLGYLLFLAWKIAQAQPLGQGRGAARPMTFLQAASFQWVNPKAWSMALTAISLYAPDASLRAFALVAAVFVVVNLPSVMLWAMMGRQLARLLQAPKRLRVFNWGMAALLIASTLPAILPG